MKEIAADIRRILPKIFRKSVIKVLIRSVQAGFYEN
jgi:hypothetical protein